MQVKVTNGGSGNPGPMTQFPGAYSDTDEYANFSIYNGIKDFPFPGPEVWSSGGGGDSAPPSGFGEIPQPSRSDERPESDDTPESDEVPEFDLPQPESSSAPVSSPPSATTSPDPVTTQPCTRSRRRSRRSRRASYAH